VRIKTKALDNAPNTLQPLRASRSRWFVGSSSKSKFGCLQQQLGQSQPHLPTPGKLVGQAIPIVFAEPSL